MCHEVVQFRPSRRMLRMSQRPGKGSIRTFAALNSNDRYAGRSGHLPSLWVSRYSRLSVLHLWRTACRTADDFIGPVNWGGCPPLGDLLWVKAPPPVFANLVTGEGGNRR